MKKLIILLIVGIFYVCAVPHISANTTSDATLIITNPGENANYEMNISFHMPQSSTQGRVVYTKKSDLNWEDAQTVYGTHTPNTAFYGLTFNQWEVSLKNLEPDTEYMYQAGDKVLSEVYYFKTAGASSYKFLSMGDYHTYNPIPGRVNSANQMAQTALEKHNDIDFIFSVGDIVSSGSVYNEWVSAYNGDHLKNHMFAMANGNHEGDSGYMNTMSNYPKNGYANQIGTSYYYTYGQTLFVVLNTENINEKNDPTYHENNLEIAQAWASEVIKNNPSQYIFVTLHYNWFSGQTGSSFQYNVWRKFFDEHEVDLAMSGHNHVYIRSHTLYDNQRVSDELGTLYLQTPSADNDRGRDATGSNNADKIAKYWSEGAQTVGAVVIGVTEEKISIELLDRQGNVQDQVEKKARRTSLYENEFKKDMFESNISMTKTDLGYIINHGNLGIGHIKKIDYLNQANEVIATNYFRKRTDTNFILPNEFENHEVILQIEYYTHPTTKLTLHAHDLSNDVVTEFKVEKTSNGFEVLWKYHQTESLIKYVFVNGIYIKSIDLLDEVAYIDTLSINDTIELRNSINSIQTGKYTTRYNRFGDINLDGVVNDLDIALIQNHVMGIKLLTDEQIRLADINLDGQITMLDATYLTIYIADIVTSITKTYYDVTFIDYKGDIISTQKVLDGTSAIAPTIDDVLLPYFIGWHKDFSYVTNDLIIYQIINPQVGTHQNQSLLIIQESEIIYEARI